MARKANPDKQEHIVKVASYITRVALTNGEYYELAGNYSGDKAITAQVKAMRDGKKRGFAPDLTQEPQVFQVLYTMPRSEFVKIAAKGIPTPYTTRKRNSSDSTEA